MWSAEIFITVLGLFGVVNAQSLSDGRVVNGSDARIEHYPFMVSLRVPLKYHACGGSIIAPNFILTAAHCVDGWRPSDITIQYAQTIVSEDGPNVIPIKQIYMHEDYKPWLDNSYPNDIALVELAGRFIYNYQTLAPVELPAQDYEVEQTVGGADGVLISWGYNETNGKDQEHLQKVDLKILTDAECVAVHNGITNGAYHICAGNAEGGKGQCTGDSGGPLLLNGHTQVGIVSWSKKPCGAFPYGGVYTKVAKYVNWINVKMSTVL